MMFVIDDLLLSPLKGFMWIVRELHKNAEETIAAESEDLTASLSTLYMMLETGQIGQEEFDAQEREILDRLDAIEAAGGDAEARADDTDEDEQGDEADDTDAEDDFDDEASGDDEADGGSDAQMPVDEIDQLDDSDSTENQS